MTNYQEFLDEIDRKAYHEGEVTWEEDGYTVTRSHHWSPPGCHNACGLLLYVKDGVLERVEGDPLDPHVNGKLCIRCLDLADMTKNPDRIKYPMLRDGERGENKWKRITWDEALDIVAEKVEYYQKTYGVQSIAVGHGTGRNVGWPVPILAYLAFQTPNVGTFFFTGFSCYLPRVLSAQAACGDYFIVDSSTTHHDRYNAEEWRAPGVIMVWANEPLKSNADGYMGHWLVEDIQLGSKIISIDPRVTWWAVHGEYHLQLRPGTDAALAMAMLNVLITEDLYNHEFVEKWCYGFEEMAASVKDTTPEWAAEVCGLDAEDIRGAIRLFATEGPGAIQWGLAFEEQASCMGLNTAVMDILGICGYFDVPGGMVIVRSAFDLPNRLSESYVNPEYLNLRSCQPGPGIPWGDTRDTVWDCEGDKSGAIRFYWVMSTNPIACPGMDAPRIYDLLKDIEFCVVCDPFITPTAVAIADMLLPVAMSPERNSIRTWFTPLRLSKKTYQFYEAKSDEEIVLAVGKRVRPEMFPWETDKDMINWRLSGQESFLENMNNSSNSSGEDFEMFDTMYNLSGERWTGTLDDLEKMGGYAYNKWNEAYYKYEKGILRADGEPGFNTPSGKFELVTFTYQAWGMTATPYFVEPYQSPVKTPELYEKYPLIMLTGGRSYEFFHSENRQSETMRELHPWPLLQMNANTAEKFGIKEGEWTWVENDLGRFKQIATITPTLADGVIHAEHGWWFPEQEGAEPNLFGTFDSNPNNCIPNDVTGPYGIAAPVKNMLVTIYPVKEGDVLPGTQVCELGGFPVQKARREAYKKAVAEGTQWPIPEDVVTG